MVSRVRIENLCDFCYTDESIETLATHGDTITMHGRTVTLDWCDKHDDAFGSIDNVLAAILEYGRRPEEMPSRSKQGKPKSLSASYRRKNNVEAAKEDGKPVFKCTEAGCDYETVRKQYFDGHMADHRGDKLYPCEEPGCERGYNTLQSLGVHKSREHGYVGPQRQKLLDQKPIPIGKGKKHTA